MTEKKYNLVKLNEIIEPLKLTPLKSKKLRGDLEWGFRFLKTWDESEVFLKKLKKLNRKLNLRKDVEKLSKVFQKSIYYSIEKIDTMWDIVWNSNPENVMRFTRSWYFNNVQIYSKENLDVADPYVEVIDESIIWIQLGLTNDNTNLIANEICAIIKNADAWLTEEFEEESYYYEINDRLNDIKIILIDQFGVTIIDYVKNLIDEANYRRLNITPMNVTFDVLENLFDQIKTLDEAIAVEKSIKILNIAYLPGNRSILVAKARANIIASGSIDLLDKIYAGLINTDDLIIDDETVSRALKRNLDLQAIFERERMIRTPRFDFKLDKSNKKAKKQLAKIISKETKIKK